MEWDNIAEYWDNMMGEFGNWYQKALIHPYIEKLLVKKQVNKILDVGCGTGHLSRYLTYLGYKVIGLDSSKEMLKKAALYTDYNIDYWNIDFEEMKTNQKFDVLIFNNSLQDMDSFSKGIIFSKEIISIDGMLILAIRHPCFYPKSADLGWTLKTDDNKLFQSGYGLTDILISEKKIEGLYFRMDDYFSNSSTYRIWNAGTTTMYNFTISQCINTLIENEYVIQEVIEPVPNDFVEKSNIYNLTCRIPIFLLIVARYRNYGVDVS